MSAHHLQRCFKRELGVSPKQYVQARRMERFKSGLKNGSNVTTATYDAGYGSSSRVYERSNERLGMTPAAYRNGGRGMNIRYTIVASAVGRVLVGTTERGVCSVMIGDDDASLAEELRREYPNADITRARQRGDNTTVAIARYARGAIEPLDLPLDVQGTAFQWQVWEALRRIPRGTTMTYREIAVALGKPKAARAVGNACANNRVSLIVPCHRAVREGGGLGGYRWGLERKAKLLEQERRPARS
jgi:AraC family transcriptional regulator of adaptative response/methylated-DNA-[protein]-cysteine methyltransferase